MDELKQKGNDAMKSNDFEEAARCYSEAIELVPDNHVLYSNRSAAYLKLEKFPEALLDAEKTIELKEDWPKGYSRKGLALFKMNKLEEAEDAFNAGLKIDPNNSALKEGLKEVTAKKGNGHTPNPFANPASEAKLFANPKTNGFMNDPSFMAKLREMQQDPKSLAHHMRDPRIMQSLAVLLGADISFMPGGDGDMSAPPNDPFVHKPGEGPSTEDLTGESSESTLRSEPMDTSKPAGEESPKKGEESPKKEEESGNRQQALKEKEAGNAAYKKKDFETALACYDKAIELDPTDITFLTNKAAVYLEQHDWDNCIKLCEEAVEKGRELRVEFKLIAKALSRIGTAYFKQEKWKPAIEFFNKSLAEHRNPDIVKKKNEAEKRLKEQEKLEYLDSDKSVEVKEKGNSFFKQGDFPNAIKCYTEALKRNPDDPKIYSNRAACYQKLLEFQLALKDCDECIRLDPKFVKGYVRKAHAYLGLKDTMKAKQGFQAALEIDPSNAEARDGLNRCRQQDDPEARRQAAMHDPEIMGIMKDPAMQLILQQMQSQPEALRDHLKNPDIAYKIEKLMQAGFISIR